MAFYLIWVDISKKKSKMNFLRISKSRAITLKTCNFIRKIVFLYVFNIIPVKFDNFTEFWQMFYIKGKIIQITIFFANFLEINWVKRIYPSLRLVFVINCFSSVLMSDCGKQMSASLLVPTVTPSVVICTLPWGTKDPPE